MIELPEHVKKRARNLRRRGGVSRIFGTRVGLRWWCVKNSLDLEFPRLKIPNWNKLPAAVGMRTYRRPKIRG